MNFIHVINKKMVASRIDFRKENDPPIVQKARKIELLYKLKMMTEDKDILVTCDLEKSTG